MIRNKKKLLYISNYPLDSSASAAIRNRAIIEGFVQCGYKVYTLTREPSSKLDIENIEQIYFKNNSFAYQIAHSIRPNKSSILWKLRVIIAKWIESINIYDNQRILLKNLDEIIFDEIEFDFVISSSDSKVSHLIAEQLMKRKKIKTDCWVQYWGDPFFDDINKNLYIPSVLIKREEERLIGSGDYILYTSPFTLKNQQKLYSKSANKMYYIPTPYVKKRLYQQTNNQNYTFGYYGSSFKKDRDIMPLYSVAKDLIKHNFQFIGSTDINLVSQHNVTIRPQVSYEEILEYESKCDVLVCIANKSSTTQIPGKLYHYAATNKPILFVYEKGGEEIAEFFKKFNRYFICENTEVAIKAEIEKIISTPDLFLAKPLEELHCKSVADRVLKIIGL